MKKLFFSFALIVILLFSSITPVSAAGFPIPTAIGGPEEVLPASEETQWVFQIKDGQLQKRLWSLTYQRWLTDWIDVE